MSSRPLLVIRDRGDDADGGGATLQLNEAKIILSLSVAADNVLH